MDQLTITPKPLNVIIIEINKNSLLKIQEAVPFFFSSSIDSIPV